MRCDDVEIRLADHRDHILPEDEEAAVVAHLRRCAECAALAETMALIDLTPVGSGSEPPRGLVEGILARTSGASCTAAETHLPSFVDGELDGATAELLAAHLAGCRRCRAVTETLAWTGPVLRSLGREDPGARFTAEVVRVTTGRGVGREGWPERLRNRLARWAHRPGFTLEVAYAGTVALALLMGTPRSPLREVPEEVLSVARVQLPVMESLTREGMRHVVTTAGTTVARVRAGGRAGISARIDRLDAPVTALRHHAGDLGDAFLDGDVGRVSVQLGRVGGDLKLVWHAITSDVPRPSDDHDHDERNEPADRGDGGRPPSTEGAR